MRNPRRVKAFGTRLRELREARGWSQQELADYAEVSKMTVHRTETAQFAVTIDVLLLLADALEVPLCELVNAPGLKGPDQEARPNQE